MKHSPRDISSFPGSAWERTALEALPRLQCHATHRLLAAGRACPAPRSQAELGNERQHGRAWKPILPALAVLLFASVALAQAPDEKPFPPHRVIGNVFYVGSKDLASYLITTPDGHILINSGFEETVPLIRASVEALGFKMGDIKILLASHAHNDHVAGHALAKELTGAKVYVMKGDDEVIASGGEGQYLYTDSRWKPCPVDRVLNDDDEVQFGGETLVARKTPGHTRGCTTWTWRVADGDKKYDVVVIGSPNVNPGFRLVDNKDYPEIADDYAKTFKILKSLPCDLFLGAHGAYYGMEAKYEKVKGAAQNPFIDPAGYKEYVDLKEKAFRDKLAEQKEATAGPFGDISKLLKVAKPEDTADVATTPPPKDAIVLFGGQNLDNWIAVNGKDRAAWKVLEGGIVEVASPTADIITRQKFDGNFRLHLEFRVPYQPEAKGQRRGNSGVYLQGRYEIQILDSYGQEDRQKDDCGAIYSIAAPRVNVCKAPTIWQSYDIDFQSPQCENGKKTAPARASVLHNGVQIHEDVEINIDNSLRGLGGDPCTPGPILLQENGCPVQYRNIWLLPK